MATEEKKFKIELIENEKAIAAYLRDGVETAARWIAYCKKHAGFRVTPEARSNWEAQLELMEVGDSMGYAMPGEEGGVEDFARVERVA